MAVAMAFKLFPKPPIKGKPGEAKSPASNAKPDPRARPAARPVSAREVAASAKTRPAAPAKQGSNESGAGERDITLTGPHSMIEWSPVSNKKILVSEANPGLCADLENAALHYANGQAAQAREVLELGIVSDDDTRNSPLAWLALFDLLQRANDRAAFDQLAQASLSVGSPAPRKNTPRPRAIGDARPWRRGGLLDPAARVASVAARTRGLRGARNRIRGGV